MLALKSFRDEAAGLPDLLNYAALIDEGIVLGKDGSLMAGFYFRGDDAASSTASDSNYLTAIVNNYLLRFGSGWAVWIDNTRLPSPNYPSPGNSHFPDPVTALIDAERREMFEQNSMYFENEYTAIFQYLPPLRHNSRLSELIYDDDSLNDNSPAQRLIDDFKKTLITLEQGLADLINMRRMRTVTINVEGSTYQSDELVNYLHFAITGEEIALRIPDCPMYLDAWLGYQELWPGDTPKLGNKFIACVAIDGFPSASEPGILNLLDGLPLAYRWSSRFIFLEKHQAIFSLNRYRLKWRQKIRGFWSQVFKSQKGVINTDALDMATQTESAINDAHSGLVSYGYYTPVIVLMHEDRIHLEKQADYVKRQIDYIGFSARIETVNALEAWLGSLPGQTYPNIRRPLIHTLNLSDLLPLASIWPGLKQNPCDFFPAGSPPLMQTVTTGATPFRLNLHVGDVGHTLIFGPTGAGKSTLLALIAAQFSRYQSKPGMDGSKLPASVLVFDYGYSLYTLCKAAQGIHYDIGNDSEEIGAVMPLADIDSPAGALWAEEWIATCYELQALKPPTPQQKTEIHRAIGLLRAAPMYGRSLTDFVAQVQDNDIQDALSHYTLKGPMGHLLDGAEDSMELAQFTTFEVKELMSMGRANALPVLLYLFRRIEKTMHGQPVLLALDEAWAMLGDPVWREKVREWLKTLRKQNCSVVLATQSLSDAVRSGLLDVLTEQCPTKILLPNKEADQYGTKETPGPADLYTMFGLNKREIEILKNGQYKRDYYYKSPLGRRLFELGLGPLALAFLAVSDKDKLAEIRYFIDRYANDWPLSFLKHKGIDYERYIGH